ncbi:MAG: protease modulator HflC [Bacillota bacterium]
MNLKKLAGLVVLFLVVVGLLSSVVIVDETRQAVITEFGKPVRTIREAGLHFKVPFIQAVRLFDRRVLEYDAAPTGIITRDKKTLIVDNYARWKIIDPLLLMQTVGHELGAMARLDDIIYSELRVELGKFDLDQIVSTHRSYIMEVVTARADFLAREYGVQILDVRIKRADLPPENEQAIYQRMRAERQRQALQYRSEGAEEAQKIRAQTDKERAILLAEAYRQSEIIRGEGDAEAIRVYAEAFQKDPDFYAFLRSLEAYRLALGGQTTLVLPHDSEFLRFLLDGGKR